MKVHKNGNSKELSNLKNLEIFLSRKLALALGKVAFENYYEIEIPHLLHFLKISFQNRILSSFEISQIMKFTKVEILHVLSLPNKRKAQQRKCKCWFLAYD